MISTLLLVSASLLDILVGIYIVVLVVNVVLSWLSCQSCYPIARYTEMILAPLLGPIRQRIPPLGGRLDLSPIFVLIGFALVRSLIVQPMLALSQRI